MASRTGAPLLHRTPVAAGGAVAVKKVFDKSYRNACATLKTDKDGGPGFGFGRGRAYPAVKLTRL